MKNNIPFILDSIYQSIADPHEKEYFSIHEIRYRFILRKIQTTLTQQENKVLDIGVYPPHLYHALKSLGYDVWGIASKHEKVLDKHVKTLNIEKEKFPFHTSSFDLVLMTEIVEHLTINPRVYLKEVMRVLKPGGFLFITTPNAVHLKNRMRVLFGKSASFPISQLLETEAHDDSIYYRHNRELTISELKHIVEVSGLSIADAHFFSAYTPFRKNRGTNVVKAGGYLMTLLFPQLRDSLYVVAVKPT